MVKSPDAFRSIGEVSRLVGVAPHVLRYWEGQFSQLSPVKRADGRRYYRPDDVRLVAGLCQVLREEGLSIRGVKRLIATDRGAGLREIGAARLGEGDTPAGEAPRSRTSAVRLARPSETAVEDIRTDMPVPLDPDSKDQSHRSPSPEQGAEGHGQSGQPSRRRLRPTASADSLPLFPGIDHPPPGAWLGRLVAISASLNAARIRGGRLPAAAAELHEQLANAAAAHR